MGTGLTKYEMETIINFNDGEDIAYISTSQASWKEKMRKLAEQYPEDVKITKENEYTLFAECPKKYIVPPRPPKKLSEEQKQKNIERLKQYQFKKKD